ASFLEATFTTSTVGCAVVAGAAFVVEFEFAPQAAHHSAAELKMSGEKSLCLIMSFLRVGQPCLARMRLRGRRDRARATRLRHVAERAKIPGARSVAWPQSQRAARQSQRDQEEPFAGFPRRWRTPSAPCPQSWPCLSSGSDACGFSLRAALHPSPRS